MTILSDLDEVKRLADARIQPGLHFLKFSLADLQAEIQVAQFPDIAHFVRTSFVTHGPLACICFDRSEASIYIHQIFNHPDTPREVMHFVLMHEFLHLRIGPGSQDGKIVNHPPEFWNAERKLVPQRIFAWRWIWGNYGGCLKNRPKLERIDVNKTWKKFWSRPKIDLANFSRENCELGDEAENAGML